MRILLLNQVFYPNVVATAQYLTELAAALAERGHQITVVTGRRAYDQPEKLFAPREIWRGVRVFRVFSTRFGKKAKWRRAADFASFIFFCCARLIFLGRQDVVIALTTPPLISFIGAWRAKLWRAKFVYWVMDMNPDEAIAAGWLNHKSLAAKILERMSRFSFHHAEKIIALDKFMRERIAAKGISPDKLAVIPPWSHDDEVRFDAVGREAFRKKYGLENKFVVMYSGNHSPIHPLDTLMAAAERLQADSIHFCFIGGGSEFKRVQQWAGEKRLANVLCLPYQPLSQLSASLSAADAHLVVMGNGFVGLVHPCKIYNILTIGIPVIYLGPSPSHVTDLFDQLTGGYPVARVGHGEIGALATHIENLSREKSKKQEISSEFKMLFAKDTLVKKLVELIEKTASSPASQD